jgi:hypothetical protein
MPYLRNNYNSGIKTIDEEECCFGIKTKGMKNLAPKNERRAGVCIGSDHQLAKSPYLRMFWTVSSLSPCQETANPLASFFENRICKHQRTCLKLPAANMRMGGLLHFCRSL